MRSLIITFFFFQMLQSFGQVKTESARGMLVLYNNRIAFFKTEGNNIKDLLSAKTQLGLELSPTAKVNYLLSFSKTIKVVLVEYKDNREIYQNESLSYVPVKILYRKINTNFHVDSCEMAFIYNSNKNIALRFLCNNTGYSIESMELKK